MKIAAVIVLQCGLMPAAAFAQPVDIDAGCGTQREYWLWPGARLPDQDQHGAIARLYLLQGFFSARGDRLQFVDQGATARPLQQVRELWLVYRLDSLPPVLPLVAQMERDLRHWQRVGNQVSGVQLDFDSATGQLADYGQFLRAVRKQLAPEFQLGITGLMDWVNQDAAEWPLDAVAEIVLQTYQGQQCAATGKLPAQPGASGAGRDSLQAGCCRRSGVAFRIAAADRAAVRLSRMCDISAAGSSTQQVNFRA